MQTDPRVVTVHYLMLQLRSRIAAIKSGDSQAGALSLEWVAIAIVLVTAALALAVFLASKLGNLESLIPN